MYLFIFNKMESGIPTGSHDEFILQQQLLVLRSSHLKSLNNLSYILHFLSFIYDESIITLIVKCIIQFVVGQRFGGKELRELGVSNLDTGRLQGLNDVRRQAHQMLMNGSNDNNLTNEEENDGIPISKITRKLFVMRLLSTIISFWIFIIIFQLVFCLGKISNNDGGTHTIFGNFRKSSLKYTGGSLITNGSLSMNLIGESMFQHWFIKLIVLSVLNLITITIHFYSIILNLGIALNLMDGLVESDVKQFDGFQGNVKIYKFNPIVFIELLVSMKNDGAIQEYLEQQRSTTNLNNSVGNGNSNIV